MNTTKNENRKAETYTMKTKTKTTEENKKQPKMKATWVSKRGCQESLLQRKKQTLRKQKATQKERQKNPPK